MELLDRHSEGVIALIGLPPVALLPADHPGARAGGARPRRRPDGRVRRRERLLRGPEQQDPRAGPRERGHRADRARAGPAAGRHGRRPLPAPRGLRDPLRAAVRADEVDARAAEAALRHERVLSEGRRPRWRSRSAQWPEAVPTTLEIAERCDIELELGNMLLPSYQTPDGSTPDRVPAPPHRGRACASATATRRPAAARRAPRDGARA